MSQNSNENLSTIDLNGEPSTDQSHSSFTTTTASIASSSPATSLQSLSLATSIGDKNEKFKIILDNPDHTYHSGQTIRGTISLNCKQKKKIRGIYFHIIGYGKCSWTDLLRRESVAIDGKGERSAIKYSGTEEYLNSTMYIVGSKNGPSFALPEGMTVYEFSFNLKSELPSSFSGGCGKIKYKMEFIVDIPWKFDKKQIIQLNIIQTVNLNYTLGTLQPFENQLTRNIGYIGTGPISVHVYVMKCGYIHGDKIPIQAIVTNHSKVHVEKLKFAFNKIIDYHSKTPGLAIKREIHRLLKKEAGGVSKKTEQRYEHVIEVPLTTPSQDSKTSRLIHIKYELKVEAKLGGLYKNMAITIPLTIGNVPHSINARPQPIFPALPELPAGLTLRPPSASGYTVDHSNISLNANYHNNSTESSHQSIAADTSTSATSSIPNSSLASTTRSRSSSLQNLSSTSNDFYPTAPPMDLNSPSTSTPVRPVTVYMDAPPSYDEVFGSPSTSGFNNSSNFSNSSALFSASLAKT